MTKEDVLKQYKAKAYDIFAELQFLQQELGKVNEEIRKISAEIEADKNQAVPAAE